MNLALFMLTFMLSGLYATESYSQTVRISLNMKNSTVKEVLKKIENCSEFTFFYNDEIIDVDKRVTLNAEDLSISDILTTRWRHRFFSVNWQRRCVMWNSTMRRKKTG